MSKIQAWMDRIDIPMILRILNRITLRNSIQTSSIDKGD